MIETTWTQATSWPRASAVAAVAAAALLLLCAGVAWVHDAASLAAPAAMEGSMASPGLGGRASAEDAGAADLPDQLPASNNLTAVKRRCERCGLVVSIREAAADDAPADAAVPADFGSPWSLMAPARYIFIVQLEDGSQHRISDSNPLAWRIGERVLVIDGAPLAQRSGPAGRGGVARR